MTAPAPSASPRRLSHNSQPFPGAPGPSSPRARHIPSRLPSSFDFESGEDVHAASSSTTRTVVGFSPPGNSSPLPTLAESSTSRSPPPINTRLPYLSPQLTTPDGQSLHFVLPDTSRANPSSPRHHHELPPRSRRNSAAIVSISLSSRSRSRTPRGSSSALPGSGHDTPNKDSSTVTPRGEDGGSQPVMVQMNDKWSTPHAPGMEEMEEWQPAGGMLLDDDVVEDELDLDDDENEKAWTNESSGLAEVEDILSKGMLFGEGLEFQGEIVRPAVGKANGSGDDGGLPLPLRRGGSEIGQSQRGEARGKKVYEVIKRLGSGSYAVVYLVREKGGRKREFALKCLSKQDLEEEQLETQLFEATIHLSLPIHTNIVTLHQTLQTRKWLFLMLELCPGEDLFYWLEKSRDASPRPANHALPEEIHPMSSSKFSSSSIPFSSSQLFSNLNNMSSSFSNSPSAHAFSPNFGHSPASLLFSHHHSSHSHSPYPMSQTPPTPSLLSAFSANTLLTNRRLRLIASMFSQMCEAVAVCHDAGVSHRDIKPENFICCDSVELEAAKEGDGEDFGPQAKRKVVVKLTDFGLATTEEESGDVECGSKPYMSYECRNNMGPTYAPAPADVWSLGIVLINMLFHRNPWKDPTEGDPNFDNFLRDPVGFLLSKFTGIGKEVATFIAQRILCVDVDRRVSARELGQWIKTLPDMIAGRKAIHALKIARAEAKADKSLFAKSPIEATNPHRKSSTSALTSSAPLSHLPPPIMVDVATPINTPGLDSDRDEPQSAITNDGQQTPLESEMDLATSGVASPFSEGGDSTEHADADCHSLSTHKRRKRGVRKGKAAQAALAAASQNGDTQAERDALLAELAMASQSLARDLSKISRPAEIDITKVEDFPPLGTSPAQVAAAKKSKWKDMMKLSSGGGGNPELAALRQRVAEREASSFGNWSAPAKLQGDLAKKGWAYRSGATASSGISSALSSFGPVSSATSSSGGVDDDDWRRPRPAPVPELDETVRGRDQLPGVTSRDADDSRSRARKAAIAAAAITGNMDPIGAFASHGHSHSHSGAFGHAVPGTKYGPLYQPKQTSLAQGHFVPPSKPSHTYAGPVGIENKQRKSALDAIPDGADGMDGWDEPGTTITINTASTVAPKRPEYGQSNSASSAESAFTITALAEAAASKTPAAGGHGPAAPSAAPLESPNKPKIKGQMQTLARMLSGLKAGKGKD